MKYLLLLLLLVVSCSKTPMTEQKRQTLTLVDTIWVPVKVETGFERIRNYSFPVEGVVDSIYVAEYCPVKRGAKLAELNVPQIENEIRLQERIVKASEKECLRTKQLFLQQARTAVQKDEAEFSLSMERLQLENIRAEKKSYQLFARDSGVVLSIQRIAGEFCGSGSVVVSVGEGSPVIRIKSSTVFPKHDAVIKFYLANRDGSAGGVRSEVLNWPGYDSELEMNVQDPLLYEPFAEIAVLNGAAVLRSDSLFSRGEIVQVEMKSGEKISCEVLKATSGTAWVKCYGRSVKSGEVSRIVR